MVQKTIRLKIVSPKSHLLAQQQPTLLPPLRQHHTTARPSQSFPVRGFFPSLAQINSYPSRMDFPDIHFQSLPADDFYTVTAKRTPQEPVLLSGHSGGPYCGYICTCTLQYLHFVQIYWKREEIKRTLDTLFSLPIFSL